MDGIISRGNGVSSGSGTAATSVVLHAGALEEFFAAFRQVQDPQVFAGLGVAFAQGHQGGDGRVVDKAQVAAVDRHLLGVVGRVELVEKRRCRGKEQGSMQVVVLAAVGLQMAVGIQLTGLLPGEVERRNRSRRARRWPDR